jgi:hypothetical protein
MDPTTIAQALAAIAQPPRPITRTPPTAQDFSAYLYGTPTTAGDLPDAQAGPPPAPLPGWIPQNVQNYINTRPSYAEGQRQATMPPGIAGGEPYSPTPQINDINRLFSRSIHQNAPIGSGISGPPLKAIIRGGYLAGGDEI